ncbi:MAG: S8 family serine peptidase [Pseudobdellovibrio sp.]
MKTFLLITSVMLIAGFASAKNSGNRFLVTFKSQQGFAAMQNYFNQESGSEVKLQKSLVNLNSIILKSNSKTAMASLANHPEVSVVEAEAFSPRPAPVYGFKPARVIHTESSNLKFRQLTEVTGQENVTPNLVVGEKTPWGITAVKAGEAWADSQAGANARVLVLDTGIDAGHQDLQANFEKGMNFSEDENGNVNPADFNDVEGHGSHCSGTIAASYNAATGFTGVAPKAKLLMGRVCSAEGCSNIAVAEGINWGVSEKVDVISMSLGGPVGTPGERNAIALAEKAGVMIVAASGNDGTAKVSFPGAYPTVVAVGALDSSLTKANFSQWGPELDVMGPGVAVISTVPRGTGRESNVTLNINGVTKTVNSAAFSGTHLIPIAVGNSLVYAGLGKPEDFTNINVAGKFALISRGEIKFSDKVKNALAAKAVGVILFNNTAGIMQGVATEDGTEINAPVVMIEQVEGQAIVTALSNGTTATAQVSTVASDYAMFDGTSMATPHVAGVVALIKSANKKLTPAQVRLILATTSLQLGSNKANEYGKGVVQADQAVKAALAQP